MNDSMLPPPDEVITALRQLLNEADAELESTKAELETLRPKVCGLSAEDRCPHEPCDNCVPKLKAELNAANEKLRWRKWPDEKPVDGRHVFVGFKNALGKRRTVKACWIPRLFNEASEFDDSDEDWLDYQEETDTYYSPQGWYEITENAENYMYQMSDQVEYEWLPIPTPSELGDTQVTEDK